ncbi:hypothetical protein [uncultured Herbaspirillum sp.]|uniref:hypothetical protein n=1 Tax=uncultured Herbaspirillum sp. TaxID=160236 RepID=UPI00258E0155|nr:hypothetical protein [uncultured Herbaspirillum sp.]
MSTDLFHFAYLKPPGFTLRGASIEQWLAQAEPTDAAVQALVADAAILEHVMIGSRNGWLGAMIQELAQSSSLGELKVLYGADDLAYEWEARETGEDDIGEMSEWSRWKATMLHGQTLSTLATAIDRLFGWSSAHLGDLAQETFSDFCSAEELAAYLREPVLSSDPTSDQRIWYGEDGNGPHCLYSFLHSVRQLCLNAQRRDESLLLIVQA